MDEKLLSPRLASYRLGVSQGTFENWIKSGVVTARVTRTHPEDGRVLARLFHPADLDAVVRPRRGRPRGSHPRCPTCGGRIKP